MENEDTKYRKRRNQNKKNKKKKIIITSILLLLLVVVLIIAGFFMFQLDKVKKTTISKKPSDLGINKEKLDPNVSNDIINIALFGTDTREKNEYGNADSQMILTIDKKHNKLKLSSVMRDSYVKVDGKGMTKINAAYAIGGPQLGIKTLNENFNLDIKDYAAVNFQNMAKIVDAFSGVDIDIKTTKEYETINMYMHSTEGLNKSEIIDVTKTGLQTLNGTQAVAYSRVRYGGGDDFVRTERQRTVLTALFSKAKQGGALGAASLTTKLLPFVETSLSNTDMITLGTSILSMGTSSLEQERFPVDGYWSDLKADEDYIKLDMPNTIDQMHKFIYDDVKPVSGTTKSN